MSTTRKSAFTRTLEYFRSASLDEATAALAAARGIFEARTPTVPTRRAYKRRAKANGGEPDLRHSEMTTGASA